MRGNLYGASSISNELARSRRRPLSLIPTVASSSAGGTATRSAAVRPAPFMGRVAPSARAGSSRRRFASGSCASASPGPAAFDSSTAGFGSSNLAAALDAGTFEGTNSTVCDSTSVIVGGNGNTIDSGNGSNGTGAASTFVGTGEYNLVTGSDDFLGAGYKNEASGADSFAGAGVSNWAEGPASFVGSGDYEYFAEQGPVPPGGNVAAGVDSFVGAGDQNEVIGNESFLGGGQTNTIASAAPYSSVAAGKSNEVVAGTAAFIGAREYNEITGIYDFIGAGYQNKAAGNDSFAGAGFENQASANESFAGAGIFTDAAGTASFAGAGGNAYYLAHGGTPQGSTSPREATRSSAPEI